MKKTISINHWEHTCGDGCCFDYGVELILNGEVITPYFFNLPNTVDALKELLEKLGVKDFEINEANN